MKYFFTLIILCFTAEVFACGTQTPIISGKTEACTNTQEYYFIEKASYYKTFNWKIKGGDLLSAATDTGVYVNWKQTGTGEISIITEDTASCIDSFTYKIQVNETPEIQRKTFKSCNGEFVELSVKQCSGCYYSWYDLRYPARPVNIDYNYKLISRGTPAQVFTIAYLVKITNNVCIAKDTVFLEIHPNANVELGDSQTVYVGDTTSHWYKINAGEKPDVQVTGGSITNMAADSFKIIWNSPGRNKVKITAYLNDCSKSDSIFVTVNQGNEVGIAETKRRNQINIYPNPANTILHISTAQKMPQPLIMYNILGEAVLQVKINAQGKADVDISGLPAGVYWLRSAAGCINASAKIVVVK